MVRFFRHCLQGFIEVVQHFWTINSRCLCFCFRDWFFCFLSEVDLRDFEDFTMKKTGNGNHSQHTWRSLLHNFFPRIRIYNLMWIFGGSVISTIQWCNKRKQAEEKITKTPLKTKSLSPENQWLEVGRCIAYWNSPFLRGHVSFGGVVLNCPTAKKTTALKLPCTHHQPPNIQRTSCLEGMVSNLQAKRLNDRQWRPTNLGHNW